MLGGRVLTAAGRARQLNLAGYVLMGISMALFMVAGFRR